MDRLCFLAGGLSHALCGTTCRRSQHDLVMILRIVADQGVDGRRLTGAGAAGHDQQTIRHRCADGLPLLLIQFDPCLFFDPADPAIHLCRITLSMDCQTVQPFGDIPLRIIVSSQIDLLLILLCCFRLWQYIFALFPGQFPWIRAGYIPRLRSGHFIECRHF